MVAVLDVGYWSGSVVGCFDLLFTNKAGILPANHVGFLECPCDPKPAECGIGVVSLTCSKRRDLDSDYILLTSNFSHSSERI